MFAIIVESNLENVIEPYASDSISENKTINNKINELTPFYIATSLDCLASKEIKSHPYIVFEDKCIEKWTIKGIGKILKMKKFF